MGENPTKTELTTTTAECLTFQLKIPKLSTQYAPSHKGNNQLLDGKLIILNPSYHERGSNSS